MKTIYIVLGILAGMILTVAATFIGVQNTAIGYEETISETRSAITIQEKRQVDLIEKLVQVVQANSKFEASTQLAVVQARSAAKAGDVESAMNAINVVAEQYPDLKSNASYTQLMTELSVSENLKAQSRLVYNDSVVEYNRFVRRFPSPQIFGLTGYKILKTEYLEFDEGTELPDQLFQP